MQDSSRDDQVFRGVQFQGAVKREGKQPQAEVLSLFSGQQIGDYTKNKELSVTIPEHGYRTAVVISAQPSMMGMFEVGVGVGIPAAVPVRLRVQRQAQCPGALDEDPVALSSLTRFPYDTGLLPVDYPIEQMNRLYECGAMQRPMTPRRIPAIWRSAPCVCRR